VTGMLLTVPGELVLILVRRAAADASSVDTASGVFGLGALLADVGLADIGVMALRQCQWARPWAALPLTLAIFQLFVVTPISFAFGFAGLASNVVIGIADALTALIGVAVIRHSSPSRHWVRTDDRRIELPRRGSDRVFFSRRPAGSFHGCLELGAHGSQLSVRRVAFTVTRHGRQESPWRLIVQPERHRRLIRMTGRFATDPASVAAHGAAIERRFRSSARPGPGAALRRTAHDRCPSVRHA
jgi:hypothetical protein